MAVYKYGAEDAFSGTNLSVRCYESHPKLKIGKGTLCGGSASWPVVKDADVYVALQSGSTSGKVSDPWDPPKVVEVQYSIQDMHAPTNVSRFKKMITWVCNQLHEGKTVHVGCIGGHGRTGTVFAAIVAEALQEKDAIQFVRKHYCKKAVESKEQVKFLMKHYGVSEAQTTKDQPTKWVPKPMGLSKSTEATGMSLEDWQGKFSGTLPGMKVSPSKPKEKASPGRRVILSVGAAKATKAFEPMASDRSLWKTKKTKV
jgi:protein-tyrosine phosphatase